MLDLSIASDQCVLSATVDAPCCMFFATLTAARAFDIPSGCTPHLAWLHHPFPHRGLVCGDVAFNLGEFGEVTV